MAGTAGYSARDLPYVKKVERMNGKNAWFLITSEEIEQIRKGLQDVGHDLPDNQCRVREMMGVIERVRDRLA
jgi:hypothetical protein